MIERERWISPGIPHPLQGAVGIGPKVLIGVTVAATTSSLVGASSMTVLLLDSKTPLDPTQYFVVSTRNSLQLAHLTLVVSVTRKRE